MPLVTAKTDLIIATAREAALAKYPESMDLNLTRASYLLTGGSGEEIQVRFELPTTVLNDGPVKPNTTTKSGYSIDVCLDVFGKVISVTKNDFRVIEYTVNKKEPAKKSQSLATASQSKAADPEETAVAENGMISVFFGERLPDGSLRRTRKIIWKPGSKYGWDVAVFSKEPSIKIKEILTLPGPATFTNKSDTPSSLTKNESIKTSGDHQTLVKEFTLDTSKPVKYGRTFKILETDPKGTHRFQLFINDALAGDVEFEIGD
ncbi:MAG: hypothetical protein K0R17_2958 [Rariglobus sp.]|jgi:hypothetical protein|nr:hypothetical protein [Rariglobus sp.]